jgi:hypothetical protein
MFLLNNESVLKPLENISTAPWDYFSFKEIKIGAGLQLQTLISYLGFINYPLLVSSDAT